MRREKTGTDKKCNGAGDSRSTFKIGAVCAIFLIIGFEAALFINRTAVLKIEALRDHPDTVFVSVGESREDDSGSGSAPRSETRVSATHSEVVSQVRKRTLRKAENFNFNPNTATIEDLMRLGFSERQAQSIDNYRKKGGRFHRKEDFKKSFVVSDSVYARLEKYIDIPKTDINKADSVAFDSLPGIGPYFASKMVEFRERLHGYSHTEQLMDIYRFDSVRFSSLKDLITCSPSEPYRLWSLPAEELRLHPYIGGMEEARAIVLFRENTPREKLTVEELSLSGILPKEKAEKLLKCRIAPPP